MTVSQKTAFSGPTDVSICDAEMDVCLVPLLIPFSVYVDWPAVFVWTGRLLTWIAAGQLPAGWLADKPAGQLAG